VDGVYFGTESSSVVIGDGSSVTLASNFEGLALPELMWDRLFTALQHISSLVILSSG